MITVKDALVDTGAALLNLHSDQINELGLKFLRRIKARTANGAPVLCDINFVSFGSVALYGRRRRGQAPTLPQLYLTEICVTL